MSAHFPLIDYQFGTWNAAFAIKRNKMDRRVTWTNESLVMLSQQFWRILYNDIAIKRHMLYHLNQEVWIIIIKREYIQRAHSWFAPSQWETSLLCNDVSHLLSAILSYKRIAVTLHYWNKSCSPFCYINMYLHFNSRNIKNYWNYPTSGFSLFKTTLCDHNLKCEPSLAYGPSVALPPTRYLYIAEYNQTQVSSPTAFKYYSAKQSLNKHNITYRKGTVIIYLHFVQRLSNQYGTGPELCKANQINIIATDALAPGYQNKHDIGCVCWVGHFPSRGRISPTCVIFAGSSDI